MWRSVGKYSEPLKKNSILIYYTEMIVLFGQVAIYHKVKPLLLDFSVAFLWLIQSHPKGWPASANPGNVYAQAAFPGVFGLQHFIQFFLSPILYFYSH